MIVENYIPMCKTQRYAQGDIIEQRSSVTESPLFWTNSRRKFKIKNWAYFPLSACLLGCSISRIKRSMRASIPQQIRNYMRGAMTQPRTHNEPTAEKPVHDYCMAIDRTRSRGRLGKKAIGSVISQWKNLSKVLDVFIRSLSKTDPANRQRPNGKQEHLATHQRESKNHNFFNIPIFYLIPYLHTQPMKVQESASLLPVIHEWTGISSVYTHTYSEHMVYNYDTHRVLHICDIGFS